MPLFLPTAPPSFLCPPTCCRGESEPTWKTSRTGDASGWRCASQTRSPHLRRRSCHRPLWRKHPRRHPSGSKRLSCQGTREEGEISELRVQSSEPEVIVPKQGLENALSNSQFLRHTMCCTSDQALGCEATAAVSARSTHHTAAGSHSSLVTRARHAIYGR